MSRLGAFLFEDESGSLLVNKGPIISLLQLKRYGMFL